MTAKNGSSRKRRNGFWRLVLGHAHRRAGIVFIGCGCSASRRRHDTIRLQQQQQQQQQMRRCRLTLHRTSRHSRFRPRSSTLIIIRLFPYFRLMLNDQGIRLMCRFEIRFTTFGFLQLSIGYTIKWAVSVTAECRLRGTWIKFRWGFFWTDAILMYVLSFQFFLISVFVSLFR